MKSETSENNGATPTGWCQAPIRNVFEVNPPKPKPDAMAGTTEVTFVPMPALDAEAGAITKPLVRTFEEVRKGFTAFRDNDVIVAKITPCFENGKAAICRGLINGYGFGSAEFHVLRSTAAVLPEYLYHFVRQERLRRDGEANMTGSVGQKRVPADWLGSVELPIAPIAEQRRIVAKVEELLARVSAARDRLAKAPTILKRFRQSILATACSGQLTADWREKSSDVECVADLVRDLKRKHLLKGSAATRSRRGANSARNQGDGDDGLDLNDLPELPDSWRYARADEIVEPGTVITYGIVLPGPQFENGVPYVRGLDIEGGRVLVHQLWRTDPAIAAKHERARLEPGDVLLCVIRHLKVAIVPPSLKGGNLTQGTVRMRPSRAIQGPYLANYLESPHAQAWMKGRYFGMDMPRINVEDARAIPIPLPPLSEQSEIVRRVEALFTLADKIEARVQAATVQVEKITQAILAKAFRGELVPTEAELAHRENRPYESASALLTGIRAMLTSPNLNGSSQRQRPIKTNSSTGKRTERGPRKASKHRKNRAR